MGAMCYSVSPKEGRIVVYICPTCGEKTLYSDMPDQSKNESTQGSQWNTVHKATHAQVALIESGLTACRNLMKDITGIHMELDESRLCHHCAPADSSPSLGLMIHLANNTVHHIEPIEFEDLKLLAEFLAGKVVHSGYWGKEHPLRDYLPRICALLGFSGLSVQEGK